MKKSVDFSKGVRGRHAQMDLKVMGSPETVWTVCIRKDAQDLIPFKLYRIERFSESDEVRSVNENGESAFYPKGWFALVDISKQTLGLLKRAA